MRSQVLTAALLLALTACGHGSPAAGPKPARTPSASPTDDDPALTVSAGGTGVDCLEHVRNADLGFWSNTLTASTPLRITTATAVGRGVRVLGGLVVPVVGGTVNSVGVTDWPPVTDQGLRKDVDWKARTRIFGALFPVQRAMLPVLHIRAVGGAQLDAVDLGYRTEAGASGTVQVQLKIRFSRTTC